VLNLRDGKIRALIVYGGSLLDLDVGADVLLLQDMGNKSGAVLHADLVRHPPNASDDQKISPKRRFEIVRTGRPRGRRSIKSEESKDALFFHKLLA
jgi:hypothetical protein